MKKHGDICITFLEENLGERRRRFILLPIWRMGLPSSMRECCKIRFRALIKLLENLGAAIIISAQSMLAYQWYEAS